MKATEITPSEVAYQLQQRSPSGEIGYTVQRSFAVPLTGDFQEWMKAESAAVPLAEGHRWQVVREGKPDFLVVPDRLIIPGMTQVLSPQPKPNESAGTAEEQ